MGYSDLEIKLIRHALDTNSAGEAANAAAMFFKELRKREVKAHQFLEANVAGSSSNPLTDLDLNREVLYLRSLTQKQQTALVVERDARRQAEAALFLAQQELGIRQKAKAERPWWKGGLYDKMNLW